MFSNRYLLLLFSIHLNVVCFSQDKPIFLPEDIESTTLGAKCLCKPGVTNKSRGRGLDLSFLQTAKSNLNEEDGFPLSAPYSKVSQQQFSIKLRVPIVNKEGFKLLAGIIYRSEYYRFKTIGADYQNIFSYLNNRTLKSAGFESIATKSWNDRFYSSFRFRVLYNGDYSGVLNTNSRYAIYNASGIFGIKKHDDQEWGIGLNFSHSFRKTSLLPFLLYNHTFNKRWGIEMVLPALISGRYNFSPHSALFLGFRYNSRSYAIEPTANPSLIYHLNHSEIRAAFTLEQRIHPWIWLDATAGVQYNFSTDFEVKNNTAASFQVEPGLLPYFKLSIFVSPPDSFLK